MTTTYWTGGTGLLTNGRSGLRIGAFFPIDVYLLHLRTEMGEGPFEEGGLPST